MNSAAICVYQSCNWNTLSSAIALVWTLHLLLQDLTEEDKSIWMKAGYKLIAEVSY